MADSKENSSNELVFSLGGKHPYKKDGDAYRTF